MSFLTAQYKNIQHIKENPDLFPQETMNRSLRHAQHLLLITYSIGFDILSWKQIRKKPNKCSLNVLLKYLCFKQNFHFNIFHLAWDNRDPV